MNRIWLALLGGSLLGCSAEAEPVDIGDTVGAKLSDYGGSWDGYAEAHPYSDGSDRVRLTLDANGGGVFIVGDSPLLEQPTDPDVWPYGQPFILEPGIEYPVTEAVVEERRIRISIDRYVLARPWCEAQTPILGEYALGQETYSCLPQPNWGSGNPSLGGLRCYVGDDPYDDEAATEVDCGKWRMCLQPQIQGVSADCACDADGCGVPEEAYVALDAALAEDGEALVGSVSGDGYTVRLFR